MLLQENRCSVHAPSKLNLCIELLGKRGDGFHTLRTVMVTTGWRDTLRVTRTTTSNDSHVSEDLQLNVLGSPQARSGVPTEGSNLVLRALELLRLQAGERLGAYVEVVKRVPNEAGLGGGSSDAAAALIAGNRVWGLGWPLERIAELAATLGSDVPFFVRAIGDPRARCAVATGRGEKIAPFQGRGGISAVIVKPPQGLSTSKVYGACRQEDYVASDNRNRSEETARALAAGDLTQLVRSMVNGLQAAATRLSPWLVGLAEHFRRSGCRLHQLSGSGSAYFGLVPSMREARRVAGRLRALCVGQVFATTIG